MSWSELGREPIAQSVVREEGPVLGAQACRR